MGLLLSGKNPAAYKTAERSTFTSTAGQTTYTIASGYNVGDIDVYLNGIRLLDGDDYYGINGTTVVLTSPANAGDSLVVVCYYNFVASGQYTKAESDSRYVGVSGSSPMTSYLRTPNYGISSTSDSLSASMEASAFAGEQGVGIKAFGRSVSTYGGDILYTADNRGAGGRHRFGYWNGTSFTNTMTLDSSGRLSIPNQPSFRSYSSTYNGTTGIFTSFASSSGTGSIATTFRNIGNNFNTSTGTFTAPIAGRYLVTAMYGNDSGGVERNIGWLYINGTNIGEWVESYGPYDNTTGAAVFYLNVNEYIQFATHPGIPYNNIVVSIDFLG